MASKWIICDIDGVIADCAWRDHVARAAKAESDRVRRNELWQEFHEMSLLDQPHKVECELVKLFVKEGYQICYITGRPDTVRYTTRQWLAIEGLPSDDAPLFMRPQGVYSPTVEYKQRMLSVATRQFFTAHDQIHCVLEDHDGCVAMYRSHGLTVLQPRSNQY